MFWDVWNIFINKFQLVLRMMQYCIMLSWAWVGIADVLVCFGTFLDVFRRFWTFLDVLQHFGTFCNILQHYMMYPNVLEHFATFCNVWGHLGTFGDVWDINQENKTIASCLAGLGWTGYVSGHFGTFWTFLAVSGRFWMFLDVSGPFRTFLDISGCL